MQKSFPIILAGLVGATVVGLSSLDRSPAAETQPVTLAFQGVVGDQPFSCGSSYRLGAAGTMVMPTDFRLYVSQVALIDGAGNTVPVTLEQDGKWQHETVALLDFEDKTGFCANGTIETRTQIVGTVPPGDYQGVRFTVGVPFELNHSDATLAPSPLNLTSLWWNWRGGYKFLRVDLETHTMGADLPMEAKVEGHSGHGTSPNHDSGPGHEAGTTGFAIHLGSTGCEVEGAAMQPTHCLNPNRPEVVLPDFDPTQAVIAVDLAALVQSNDLGVNTPHTAPGCMSDPDDGDCLGILRNLGLPFRGEPAATQTVFRVQ